jgi:hypothetical protein
MPTTIIPKEYEDSEKLYDLHYEMLKLNFPEGISNLNMLAFHSTQMCNIIFNIDIDIDAYLLNFKRIYEDKFKNKE